LINTLRVVFPIAAVGLVITSAAHLMMSFQPGRSWLAHVGRLLLLLSALVLLWVVIAFNLYGFGLQF